MLAHKLGKDTVTEKMVHLLTGIMASAGMQFFATSAPKVTVTGSETVASH